MSLSQIAAELDCTKVPVRKALIRAGIPRRPKHQANPWAAPKRKVRVLGVGVDAVDIARFRLSLEQTPSMRTRPFTTEELDDLAARADPVPGLAARFAAREAVMKAMGPGLGAFGFHEAWVRRAPSGEPSLVIVGRAAQLAAERGITQWLLSVTHTDLVAIAHVVAQ
jgi:holo-[acyl-carrier protein] synthase